MSFAAEFIADNSGKWCGNGWRFETKEEADSHAIERALSWMLVREWRTVESKDPVNGRWTPGGAVEACEDCAPYDEPHGPRCRTHPDYDGAPKE